MRRFSFLLVVLGGAPCIAACTSVKSSDVKTQGMSALMQVTDDGSGQTVVRMQLNVDNNATDFIDLSPGDSLMAYNGTQGSGMGRNDIAGDVYYTANFTGADAENTMFRVALNRTSDVSAPNSTASLPKPFNITAPPAGKSYSRATDDITVTYDTTGTADGMTWELSGDCVNGGSGTVTGDTGSFTILHASLPSSDPMQKTTSCSVSVILKRTRSGQVDPAYGYGGSASATQTRTVMFTSTP
jgi:hypothetical protein